MINRPKSHLQAVTDPASHDTTMMGFFLPKRESSQIWHDNGSSMARMGSSSEGRSRRHRTTATPSASSVVQRLIQRSNLRQPVQHLASVPHDRPNTAAPASPKFQRQP
ncbi:hypothetical protein ACLOJK_003735 [Asimina triloba]